MERANQVYSGRHAAERCNNRYDTGHQSVYPPSHTFTFICETKFSFICVFKRNKGIINFVFLHIINNGKVRYCQTSLLYKQNPVWLFMIRHTIQMFLVTMSRRTGMCTQYSHKKGCYCSLSAVYPKYLCSSVALTVDSRYSFGSFASSIQYYVRILKLSISHHIISMGGECRMACVAVAIPTLSVPHQHFALLSLLATPTLTCWLIILCFGHTNFGNHPPPMIISHLYHRQWIETQ